jgi:hypothetical protein
MSCVYYNFFGLSVLLCSMLKKKKTRKASDPKTLKTQISIFRLKFSKNDYLNLKFLEISKEIVAFFKKFSICFFSHISFIS